MATFLSSEVRYATRPGFPIDDAWIHAVFARNLVEGHGFSFNPGEPIGGSTAPLWTLAMAASYAASGNMVWGTKVLGAALYLAGIACAIALVQQITGDMTSALLAGILVALLRFYAWGAAGGMEVPLYVVLSIAATTLFLAADDSPWKRLGSTCLFALAVLARPECLVLIVIAALSSATHGFTRRPLRYELRGILIGSIPHIAILALVLSPSIIFNLQTVGTPMPNTFNAKVGGDNAVSAVLSGDPHRILKTAIRGPLFHLPVYLMRLIATNAIFFPFALLGLKVLWNEDPRGAHLDHGTVRISPTRFIPVAFLLCPLAMAVVEPGAMLAYRYITHLLVFYCCLGAIGFVAAGRLFQAQSRGIALLIRQLRLAGGTGAILLALAALSKAAWLPPLKPLILKWTHSVSAQEYVRALDHFAQPALFLLCVIVGALALMLSTRRTRAFMLSVFTICVLSQAALTYVAASRYGRQVDNINGLHVTTGEWLDHNTPRDALLALDDIGAIAYTCRRPVVDMVGLISPEAIRFKRAGKSIVEYVSKVHPSYVATVHPRPFEARSDLFRVVHTQTITDNISSVSDSLIIFATIWHPDQSN
jgi:hypothetical protein